MSQVMNQQLTIRFKHQATYLKKKHEFGLNFVNYTQECNQ